jgi:hypothetical protein
MNGSETVIDLRLAPVQHGVTGRERAEGSLEGVHMNKDFAPSRRQLIAGGAVLAAMLPGVSVANAKPFAMQDLDDWHAQIGKEFALNGAAIRLVAVKQGKRQPAGMARTHNFTTVFEVTSGALPEAGLHKVSHAELGQASLYLERSVAKNGQPRLRASFS